MSLNMILTLDIDEEKYCKIPLKNRKNEIVNYAIIDKEDYEKVNKYNWHCSKTINNNGNIYYSVNGKINKKKIRLSHYILEKPIPPNVIDHINNNTFDNSKENLRNVSPKLNGQNRKKTIKLTTSKYIGVSLVKISNKWRSRYADINLGTYENEIDAAIIYDKYVFKNLGKYASTNNLIKYEDVINLTNKDILPVKNKKDSLPKNIIKSNNYFKVSIIYNSKLYSKNYIKTLDEATKILEKFKEEILIVKQDELIEHNKLQILRNEDGYAIINIFNDKKEITNSTIVDDDKWHELSLIRWCMSADNYAFAKINGKNIRLSRYLLNAPDNIHVDHINNNIMDNRVINLRLATDTQNIYNKSGNLNSSSIYKGVSKRIDKSNNITYRAQIEKEDKCYYLGYFPNEIIAAIAYNIKAKKLFEDFAHLNKVDINDELYTEYKNIIFAKWNAPKKIYKGIKDRKTSYLATITKDKKEYCLGSYKIDTIAALAYNLKYIEFYGEDNLEKLNTIDVDDETYKKYKEEIFAKWKKSKVLNS